jgi:hypothetical protein
VCVCGSSYNQHCSAAFGMPLVLTKQAQHPSYPLLWCLAHPTAIVPISQCCVCVWFQLQSTLLRCFFGKPLELTKPAPHPSMRTCTLLSIFVHSFSSLSPSFSLTFSFLNLSFLLSPFSIFLSYFLLSQSFSLTFSFFYLSLFMCPRLFHSQFNI